MEVRLREAPEGGARLVRRAGPETAADDTLPRRFLETPLELGSGRTAALTEDRLRAMVGGYYAARGWDTEGRPASADLDRLLLDDGAGRASPPT